MSSEQRSEHVGAVTTVPGSERTLVLRRDGEWVQVPSGAAMDSVLRRLDALESGKADTDRLIADARSYTMSPAEREEQRQRFAEANVALDKPEANGAEYAGNLLAIIHGDGGHYITEHGWKKAVDDAIEKWYAKTNPDASTPASQGTESVGQRMARAMIPEGSAYRKSVSLGSHLGHIGSSLLLTDFDEGVLVRTRNEWREFIAHAIDSALAAQRPACVVPSVDQVARTIYELSGIWGVSWAAAEAVIKKHFSPPTPEQAKAMGEAFAERCVKAWNNDPGDEEMFKTIAREFVAKMGAPQ